MFRRLQFPNTYCHSGDLGVIVRDNNERVLVTESNGVAHAVVKCAGPVPHTCGKLTSASRACSSRSCPCAVDEASMQWPYQHALVAHVLSLCTSNVTSAVNHAPRVLNIGLGAGALAMHLVKRCPHSLLENVDIDQTVVDLARVFFGFDAHVEVSDALPAVERRASSGIGYDAITVDCFNDEGVPHSCRDERFVKALATLVKNTEGVVAMHVWGSDLLPLFQRHFSHARIEKAGLENIIVASF